MEEIDGEKLINEIALNKSDNVEVAKNAFIQFCSYYEERVAKMCITLCKNWSTPEQVGYDIAQCIFEKVWMYPTFNKAKAKYKNTDKAISNWLYWIALHELSLYSQKGECSHPQKEDLPLITSTEMFIVERFKDEYLSEEAISRMKVRLDTMLLGLKEREKVIYLTYKLYKQAHRNVPKNVLNKLRSRYNISQDYIRQIQYRVVKQIEENKYE